MTGDPAHRRTMQAAGSAPFVGHSSDRSRGERARSLEAPDRHGPLRTGRFVVEIDGVQVDGFRVVDLPARATRGPSGGSEDADGGRGWGQSEYEDLEMERGLRAGDSTLHDWRTSVDQGEMEAARKSVVVSLQEETGTTALQWQFRNARPLAYEPPTLDATTDSQGTVATASVTVDFDAVERVADTGPVDRQRRPDSGVFRYVRTANGGRIERGGVVVTASDLGIERVRLGGLDPTASVDGQHVSLLVPEGARADGSDATALWLLAGTELDRRSATVASGAEGRLYWVPARRFFHDRGWQFSESDTESAGDDASGRRSIPGWPTDDGAAARVLFDTSSRSLATAFGESDDASSREALGVQPATAGETVDAANTVLAVVGPSTAPFETPAMEVVGSGPRRVGRLFDAGGPAPLAGATFGLATFSTPDAAVARQPVNPLVGMETATLLEHEVARRVMGQAGITDVDTVEWLDGPRASATTTSTRMLGTETTVESYQGVVSGAEGPWAIGAHVARITDDAHVIAVGVHRRPIGTIEGLSGTDGWQQTLARARVFTAGTAEQLEYL
jgi:phage tail-like protein